MADRWRHEGQDRDEHRNRSRWEGESRGWEGRQGGQQDRSEPFGEGGRQGGHRQEFGEGSGEERGRFGYGRDRFGGAYGGGGFGGENWPGGQDPTRRGYGEAWGEDRYGSGYRSRAGGQGFGGGGLGGEDWQGQEDRGFGENWRGGSQQPRHGGQQQRSWIGRAADAIFGHDEAEYGRDTDRQRGHFGKGPKGYTRSDDRIRDDVNDRLTDDWQVDASNIEVQVSSCEVTLTGTVNSREEKRRAEDIAEQVSGVKHVQNNLRVQQGAHTSSAESGRVGAGTTSGEATTRSRK